MKKKIIVMLIVSFLSVSAYSDNYDVYKIFNESIYESIERNYINSIGIHSSYSDGVLHSVSASIYFRAGLIELNDYFNNIIENELLIKLINSFGDISISINTYYPFMILFTNDYNYGLNEKLDIINDIYETTNGIIIENIFQKSIYGYYNEKYFKSSIENTERVKKIIHNNFNKFLEVIVKYYGIGNIINFN